MPSAIRPTQNKVRKALFDILGDIQGLSFLELFAGSASVGFEAVSRGIAELVLVEQNYVSQSAIKENIRLLKLDDCRLYPYKADKAIQLLQREKKQFNIIFLDPPYYKGPDFRQRLSSQPDRAESLAKKTLQMIGAYDILAPNGLLVAQHFKKDILPQAIGNLTRFKEAAYGDTLLSFYNKV